MKIKSIAEKITKEMDSIDNCCISFIKKNGIFMFSMFLFSFFVYFQMISNGLLNCHDGLWEGYYHRAGGWEVACGRWVWVYVSKLRFGISSDPGTSLIALICFSLGLSFAADLLIDKYNLATYLAGGLFVASAPVLLQLSYHHQSVTFSMAFLFSSLSVWCLKSLSNKWISIAVSSLFVCLSLGSYQTYIGCVSLLFAAYLITNLLNNEELFLKNLIRGIAAILAGGIEYLIVWEIHLRKFQVSKTSQSGADSYSLLNTLANLPKSFVQMYRLFFDYCSQKICRNVFFGSYKLYLIVYLLAAVLLVPKFIAVFKKKTLYGILGVLLYVLIPAAASSVKLVVTQDGMNTQMTTPYAFVIPVILMLCSASETKDKSILYGKRIVVLLGVVLLWSSLLQVEVDQKTMKETTVSSENIINMVCSELCSEHLISDDYRYCFIGIPANNTLFVKTQTFDKSNDFARLGEGWLGDSHITKSWVGLTRHIGQYNIPIVGEDAYTKFKNMPEVETMPVYPADGSIRVIDDVVVVKVSE